MRWKILGLAVFAVLVAAFTLANSSKVVVSFLVKRVELNLILVILISILLGMILMAFLWSLRAWKWRGQMSALRRRITELEATVKAYTLEENARAQSSTEGNSSPDEGVQSASETVDEG